MSETSPRQFLELLKKSELVETVVLKKSLSELSKQVEGKPVRLKALCDHLVATGLITEWHREKLAEGKYKGFFLGQYRLLRLLGTGGMSTVYLAEHKLSRHRRAIKVLPKQRVADKSYLDRFYQEGRAAAAMNDPNIVRIYDLANDEDVHYMVMEYVEGIDLQELVQRDGPLPVDRALRFIRQAATGLKHAHDRKIVHRDVKPSNLLANSKDEIKVLDLGLALMREATESLTIMHNDRVMGTADYLSPEQAIDSHEVDHRADIYSLGCTLYFLLTGQPPFPDGSIAQRIAMHQRKEAPLASEINKAVPESVAQLCYIMMRKTREDRMQGCRELISEINHVRNVLDGAIESSGHTDLALAGIMDSANVVIGEVPPKKKAQQTQTRSANFVTATPVPAEVPATVNKAGANGSFAKPTFGNSAPPTSARSTGPVNKPSPGKELPARNGKSVSAAVAEKPPNTAGRSRVPEITIPDAATASVDSPAPAISAPPRVLGKRKKANQKTVMVVGTVIFLMFGTLLAVLVIAIKMVQ